MLHSDVPSDRGSGDLSMQRFRLLWFYVVVVVTVIASTICGVSLWRTTAAGSSEKTAGRGNKVCLVSVLVPGAGKAGFVHPIILRAAYCTPM
jgi:hypothetical protein